jgi:hypothetical protein
MSEEVVDGHIRNVGFVRWLSILCAEDSRRAEDLVIEIDLARLDKGEDCHCRGPIEGATTETMSATNLEEFYGRVPLAGILIVASPSGSSRRRT